MPTPPASPTPASNAPAHAVWSGIWTAFKTVSSQHPWLAAVFGLLVLAAVVRSMRVAIHSGPRDAVRCFSRADKTTLLGLAGHRCEHHGWITSRCRSTDGLEADHVHPWSRGGWTHISNGQILCRAHNRAKSAAIPWDRTLRKLAERRVTYYPAGASRPIVRHRPRDRARSAA